MTTTSRHTCDHCGLSFSLARTGVVEQEGEKVFCCVGCQAVYHTLHEAGLDDFYRFRSSWSEEVNPVNEEVLQKEGFSLLDNDLFLEENSALQDDGTRQIELHLDGVHCAGCVWLVERMPQLVEGVSEARLELARRRMTLRWNPELVPLSAIARWLTQFGFEPHPLEGDRARGRATLDKKMLIRVGICWAVAANVMLMSITLYAGLDPITDGSLHQAVLWTLLGLSTVSIFVGGSFFFRRAWANLKTGILSMDVPISLGILVGYGHSAWMTFLGSGEVWFDSIAVLTAALLSARYLQMRGNSVAADAAERLISLLPREARRLRRDSQEAEIEIVPAETLEVGDRIEVRAGDVVPADGFIYSGTTRVSRAVLTGESRPEAAGKGQFLEAGSTNLASPIRMELTAVGANTRVGNLMQWVRSRGEERAPILQLADRFSRYFIAFVLLASLGTALAWWAIDPTRAVINVVALLVIACPCALGMATPLALTVGIGQAARRGIHIKNDDIIEALTKLTDVVFDKTGTLTEGRPTVAQTIGNKALLQRASILEQFSRHPLAEAIRRAFPTPGQAEQVEEIPGAGIKGIINGEEIVIARVSYFTDLSPEFATWARERAQEGLTPVAVSSNGEVLGLYAIGDALRPEAPLLVKKLQTRGIRVHLLSGDHKEVVQSVARQLGIDERFVRGGVTPEEKHAAIEALMADDSVRVAMIGDGVNDAAALQTATIGIAVHGGAEASLVAADVFLVQQGVAPIEELLLGSERIMAVVHRNLVGSGLYNFFGISLAALGFITPLLAAVLMPISSLAVVASSILQRSFGRKADQDSSRTAEIARNPPLLSEVGQ